MTGDRARRLAEALRAAASAGGVEPALSAISAAALDLLGDGEAHLRPGALKPGERAFAVSGFFMLSPDGRENVLVAEHGFPPEQRRLRIPADLGHPGRVAASGAPLLLENTDDHPDFEQILKTARMGSAMYSPLVWRGRYWGQSITAAQARNTYGPDDHALHRAMAEAAAAMFMAHGGPAFVASLAA